MVYKFNHWILVSFLAFFSPNLFAQADSMSFPHVYIGMSMSKPLDFFYPGVEITSTFFADRYHSFGTYVNYFASNSNTEGKIKEQGGTLGITGKIYFDHARRRSYGRRTVLGFRQTYIFTKVTGEREYWRQNRSYKQIIDVNLNIMRAATYLTFGRKYNLRPTVNLYWEFGYGLKYVLNRNQKNIPDDAEITSRRSHWYNRTLLHEDIFRTGFFSFNVEFLVNNRRRHNHKKSYLGTPK